MFGRRDSSPSDDDDDEAPHIVGDGVSLWATYDSCSTYCETQLAELYGMLIDLSSVDPKPEYQEMKEKIKKITSSYRKASCITVQMKDETERRLTQKIKEVNAANRYNADKDKTIQLLHRELQQHMDSEAESSALNEGPTGDVLIVSASVSDVCLLWDTMPDLMFDAIETFSNVIKTVSAKWNGYELKTEMGEFVIVFAQPFDGLNFCLGLQEGLLQAKWDSELLQAPAAATVADQQGNLLFQGLRCKVGVSYGQPTMVVNKQNRANYAGTPVNIATILSEMARGGETLMSHEAFEVLKQVRIFEQLRCIVEKCGTKELTKLGGKKMDTFSVRPLSLKARQFEIADKFAKLEEKQRMNWWLTKVAVNKEVKDLDAYVQGQANVAAKDILIEKERLETENSKYRRQIEQLQADLQAYKKELKEEQEGAQEAQQHRKKAAELAKTVSTNLKPMDIAKSHQQSLMTDEEFEVELKAVKVDDDLNCGDNMNVSTLKKIIHGMHKKSRQFFYIVELYLRKVQHHGMYSEFNFVQDWIHYDPGTHLLNNHDLNAMQWKELHVTMHDAIMTQQKEAMLLSKGHYVSLYYSCVALLGRCMLSLLQFVPKCLDITVKTVNTTLHGRQDKDSKDEPTSHWRSADKGKTVKKRANAGIGALMQATQASKNKDVRAADKQVRKNPTARPMLDITTKKVESSTLTGSSSTHSLPDPKLLAAELDDNTPQTEPTNHSFTAGVGVPQQAQTHPQHASSSSSSSQQPHVNPTPKTAPRSIQLFGSPELGLDGNQPQAKPKPKAVERSTTPLETAAAAARAGAGGKSFAEAMAEKKRASTPTPAVGGGLPMLDNTTASKNNNQMGITANFTRPQSALRQQAATVPANSSSSSLGMSQQLSLNSRPASRQERMTSNLRSHSPNFMLFH